MKTQKLLVLFILFIFGCSSEEDPASGLQGNLTGKENQEQDQNDDQNQDVSINYVNIESPRGTRGTWKKEWSQEVGKAIDEHSRALVMETTIPESDLVKLNCKGFNDAKEEDKKRFWALLFSSISLYESDFVPTTRFWERGLNLWSEGLFQLSVSTGKYHTGCGHLTKENILEPLGNVNCAVAVMRNQMRVRGALFPGKAYYWSVLSSSTRFKVQSFFKSQMSELSFCHL